MLQDRWSMNNARAPSEPAGLNPIIGRDEIVGSIADKLLRHRLVTIVGLGGIGKTRIAYALVHTLSGAFAEATRFIDLGPLRGGALVSMTLASAFGLPIRSDDPLTGLIGYLKNRRALIGRGDRRGLTRALRPVYSRP